MTAPFRRRSRARELALQLLFQFDLRGADYAAELGTTGAALCQDAAEGDAEVATFAQRLVEGVLAERAAIDARLQQVARNWDLQRMANVDRNVLRLAMYELMHCADVPPKVAINEAIELAKKFSTANSGGFVNGILDRVRIDLERERRPAQGQAAPARPASTPPAGDQGSTAQASAPRTSGNQNSGPQNSSNQPSPPTARPTPAAETLASNPPSA
ncbi:MAG: transcription antitermination factor NusB [Planctomycetes bacterium]|nr:transcription antitermination factor NusB [Planctomycetota bacterium]